MHSVTLSVEFNLYPWHEDETGVCLVDKPVAQLQPAHSLTSFLVWPRTPSTRLIYAQMVMTGCLETR